MTTERRQFLSHGTSALCAVTAKQSQRPVWQVKYIILYACIRSIIHASAHAWFHILFLSHPPVQLQLTAFVQMPCNTTLFKPGALICDVQLHIRSVQRHLLSAYFHTSHKDEPGQN